MLLEVVGPGGVIEQSVLKQPQARDLLWAISSLIKLLVDVAYQAVRALADNCSVIRFDLMVARNHAPSALMMTTQTEAAPGYSGHGFERYGHIHR